MSDESIREGDPVVYPPVPTREAPAYESFADRGLSWMTLQKDKYHLKVLSIFWYIFSGLNALGSVMQLLLIPLGFLFLSMSSSTPVGPPAAPGGPPSGTVGPPPFIGYVYIGLGIFGFIYYGILSILAFFSARSLGRYKRWTHCIVVAALKCISIPMGTILGIFTIVVLNRPSVKEMFKNGDPSTSSDKQIPQQSLLLPPADEVYPPEQRFSKGDSRKDLGHLRLLSIFYYIVAILGAIVGLFPGFYVAFGVAMASGSMGPPPKGPPPELGFVFIGVGSFFILIAETLAVCVFIAGRSLAVHKRYTFCFVIAVVLCLTGIPVMILGVFSVLVLARESAKELFKQGVSTIELDPDND